MRITYQIDHPHRLVDARAHGVLRGNDILRYQREVWGRADVVGYNEIVDVSSVSSIVTTSAERIRQLAKLSADMDPANIPSKFAIVAAKSLYADLGRLYATYRELQAKSTKHVRVFGTRAEALRWLGIDERVS